jgi:hypothetical protein
MKPALTVVSSSLSSPSVAATSSYTTTTTVTQLPSIVDLLLYTGDDFSMTLTLTNSDGSATNLTGYTAQAQIRSQSGSTTISTSFVTSTVGNQVILSLPSANSQGLVGNYVWDCQVTSQSGIIQTLVAGSVSFTQDVTR